MKIINLTQHTATADQRLAGVVDVSPTHASGLHSRLNFDTVPSMDTVESAAFNLARVATSHGAHAAMIGGAPFLMAPLEAALVARGIKPCYAFSKRESVEETMPDGSVRKVNVFRHAGFVWPHGEPRREVLARMSGREPGVGRFDCTQFGDEWFLFVVDADDALSEITMDASCTIADVQDKLRELGFTIAGH